MSTTNGSIMNAYSRFAAGMLPRLKRSQYAKNQAMITIAASNRITFQRLE
jgi:hypothetical protein